MEQETPNLGQTGTVSHSTSAHWSEVKSLSHVWFFATSWTVACQAPPSMRFSRHEYWNGRSFSRGSSWPRDRTWVSCTAGRLFTVWATREAYFCPLFPPDCSHEAPVTSCRVSVLKHSWPLRCIWTTGLHLAETLLGFLEARFRSLFSGRDCFLSLLVRSHLVSLRVPALLPLALHTPRILSTWGWRFPRFAWSLMPWQPPDLWLQPQVLSSILEPVSHLFPIWILRGWGGAWTPSTLRPKFKNTWVATVNLATFFSCSLSSCSNGYQGLFWTSL